MSPKMWFRLLGLSCLLVAVAFVVPGLTQGEKGKGKKYALLVGVTEYDSNNFSTLKYTGNDAKKMAETLKKAGYEVRLLTKSDNEKDAPTAANIRAALKRLVEDKRKDDTVLVGLAGHGVQLEVEDKDGKEKPKQYLYFCPQDASKLGISFSTGRSPKLLLLDDLFDQLGKCDAGHKLALIDACRNEDKVQAGERRIDAKRVTMPDGVAALFSCGRGQTAWETKKLGGGHGVFFHFVIEGLSGKAKNGENVVTWDGLSEFVKREVTRAVPTVIGDGAKQTPASMAGNLEGESPLLARIDAKEEEPKKEKDGGTKVVKKDEDKDGFTNSIGMKFKRIPKGKFTMGSPRDEKFRSTDEDEHKVEITKDFYLGVHEVTQKQYRQIMGKNPSWFSADGKGADKVKGMNTDDFPVENVSWEDAHEFLKKLKALPAEKGREYRLPTEAQWEYACRGGETASNKPYHFKRATDSLSSVQANYNGKRPYGGVKVSGYLERTNTVGKNGEANALELFDMHGNVDEWCEDWYAFDSYGKSPPKDPSGPDRGSRRVLRGGRWSDSLAQCRAASRAYEVPGSRGNGSGIRVAVVPPK